MQEVCLKRSLSMLYVWGERVQGVNFLRGMSREERTCFQREPDKEKMRSEKAVSGF